MIRNFNKFTIRKEDHDPVLHDIIDKGNNPYAHIKISICISCRTIDRFKKFIKPLVTESDVTQDVELIVKIDNAKDAICYETILQNHNIAGYKILQYPSYHGRWTNVHFWNDMASMSSGQVVWAITDDIVLQYGDWRNLFLNTRNTLFKDNIYCIQMPTDQVIHEKESCKIVRPSNGAVAVTAEWISVLGLHCPVAGIDKYFRVLAYRLGRNILLEKKDIYCTTPPSKRMYSSKARKMLFDPICQKALAIFQEKLSESNP